MSPSERAAEREAALAASFLAASRGSRTELLPLSPSPRILSTSSGFGAGRSVASVSSVEKGGSGGEEEGEKEEEV